MSPVCFLNEKPCWALNNCFILRQTTTRCVLASVTENLTRCWPWNSRLRICDNYDHRPRQCNNPTTWHIYNNRGVREGQNVLFSLQVLPASRLKFLLQDRKFVAKSCSNLRCPPFRHKAWRMSSKNDAVTFFYQINGCRYFGTKEEMPTTGWQ